ncbi:MAG TPA: LysR family transcriptional regulator [Kofleriaceae bacterium]
MALDDLAVFIAVARETSFTRAAKKLDLPSSSVSRAVARLEDDLGISLLRRTSRTVALTHEGRLLLERASGHLEGLAEALDAVTDRETEPAGVVRVTAPAFTGATRVAHALADFAAKHPKVVVELDATNAIRDLVADGYDFGVRVGSNVDADFIVRPLWTSRFSLYATTAVRRSLGKRITREILETTPAVVLRQPITWRFAHGEVTPNARFVVNDPRAAIDVARRGLGLVLAPIDAAGSGLVPITSELGEPRAQDLFVVYPTRRLLPLRVRMAIDWLTK